jgi:dolichyl-diphosphooligosaccharide--protein glycosyltransferase
LLARAVVVLLAFYSYHAVWVSDLVYSSPSIVLQQYQPDGTKQLYDDYRGPCRPGRLSSLNISHAGLARVPRAVNSPFRRFWDRAEAYMWLRRNTAEDARVMSWWDYGYQLGMMVRLSCAF